MCHQKNSWIKNYILLDISKASQLLFKSLKGDKLKVILIPGVINEFKKA
jgi:hypothetical protein